jgi:general secretion pathway protein G
VETYRIRLVITALVLGFNTFGLLSCGNAASPYQKTVVEAQESVLRDDLSQMRRLIDQYTVDNGKLPQSLEDLARAGYLREVPDDPMTGKKDWRLVIGEPPSGKGAKGIINIRSASTAKSLDGKPYNEW